MRGGRCSRRMLRRAREAGRSGYPVARYIQALASRGMSEQAFFALSALAGEPLHGYAVMKQVTDLSEGRIRLRVGTLYGILDRMAADGTIELDREEVVDSRLRRYYRLTDRGRHTLTREAANARTAMQQLAAFAAGTPGAEAAARGQR